MRRVFPDSRHMMRPVEGQCFRFRSTIDGAHESAACRGTGKRQALAFSDATRRFSRDLLDLARENTSVPCLRRPVFEMDDFFYAADEEIMIAWMIHDPALVTRWKSGLRFRVGRRP